MSGRLFDVRVKEMVGAVRGQRSGRGPHKSAGGRVPNFRRARLIHGRQRLTLSRLHARNRHHPLPDHARHALPLEGAPRMAGVRLGVVCLGRLLTSTSAGFLRPCASRLSSICRRLAGQLGGTRQSGTRRDGWLPEGVTSGARRRHPTLRADGGKGQSTFALKGQV